MSTLFLTPQSVLQPYIHHYLYFDIGRQSEWTCTNMAPPGCASLTITIGRPVIFIRENDQPSDKYKSVVFVGQTTRFKRLFIYDRLKCFFVIFQPCGVYPLLGVHQGECRNQCISLSDLLGSPVRLFEDELYEQTSGDDIKSVVENYLLKRILRPKRCELKNQENSLRLANIVDRMILQSCGGLQITKICQEEGYSISRLERHMKKIVGVSPKQFQRIMRFNKVLNYIKQCRSSCNWSQIATRFGYYDQTHFIKEFKYFYGKTPSEWSINDRFLVNISV